MRLYEFVVRGYCVAEDAETARSEVETMLMQDGCDITVEPATAVPPIWENCFPYGANENRTCSQWLEKEATP